MNCELCAFNNPKGTVTAAIIKDAKVLFVKRNEEPHKGKWDLPGGYMEGAAEPLIELKREMLEELGLKDADYYPMNKVFPGWAEWKGHEYPILSHPFLVDMKGSKIKLNHENKEYVFVPLKELMSFLSSGEVAFDSNNDICKYLYKNFGWVDLERIKKLVEQLDSAAIVKEFSIYKAILQGTVVTKFDGAKLVGMGWYFPRQTALRYQAIIEDMIVDAAYRGKHIGEDILRELLDRAKTQGIEVMELTTNPKRIAANSLYQKAGFKLHETNHYLLKP